MPFRVVVVDYDCPDDTADWCMRTYGCEGEVVVVRVTKDGPDASILNRSHARNVGAAAVGRLVRQGKSWPTEVLAFVDADAMLEPTWLEDATQALLWNNAAIVTPRWDRVTHRKEKGVGCCVVRDDVFRAVRGYDESFEGWGWEDSDFHNRCQQHGPAVLSDGSLIRMLVHSQAERVAFHDTKEPRQSKLANMELARQRDAAGKRVNPDGYGQGDWEICWAACMSRVSDSIGKESSS
jgi:hypothetical protein